MSSFFTDIELQLWLPSSNKHNVSLEQFAPFIEAAISRFLVQDLEGEIAESNYNAGYFSVAFYDELIADLNADFETGIMAATLFNSDFTYSESDYVIKSDNKLYQYVSDVFVEVEKFTTAANNLLWHVGGLAKLIGWMVWTMATPHIAFQMGNTGVLKRKSENLEPASSKEVAELNKSQVVMIETLRTNLHRYLINNYTDFATYYDDNTDKKINTNSARRFAGFAGFNN